MTIVLTHAYWSIDGTGEPNPQGIQYYNSLIDALLEKGMKGEKWQIFNLLLWESRIFVICNDVVLFFMQGIQPFVTLYHWDLPQALQDRYGGFLSDQVVYVHSAMLIIYSFMWSVKFKFWSSCTNCSMDFEHYANVCFQAFGDRVKHWMTFNEPHGIAIQGFNFGVQAPGRCSILGHLICKEGKSSVEPYIVAHNILLSHAAAYTSYHKNFKVSLLAQMRNYREMSSNMIDYQNFGY